MSSGQWQPTPQPFNQPPAGIDEFGEPRSKWPSVLGIISIVFASMGLLCYGCGSANTIFAPLLVGAMPADQRPPTPQGLQLVIEIARSCSAFILSCLLLAAGIGLLKRRPWARTAHLVWAVLKIILVVVSLVIGLAFMDEMLKQINDQMTGGGKRQAPFTLTREMLLIGSIVLSVWFLIYPIILIAWFSRAKIKDEVASWRQAQAGI